MLLALQQAIAQELRQIPQLGAVYDRPIPEVARRFPSVMVLAPDASYRAVTRDGWALATVTVEIWLGMPVDQKTSDVAWNKVQEAIDAIVARLGPIENFGGLGQNGGIDDVNTQLVMRPPEAGGPYIEARLRLRVLVPFQVQL